MTDPADPWLIAAAVRLGLAIVSDEVSASERRRPDGRIRIPDVCAALRIECIAFDEFVRREGLD